MSGPDSLNSAGSQDRLVAEFQRVETRLAVGLRAPVNWRP